MIIGTVLGDRYELIEKIGEGGMAEVYKAKCHKLNRFDAVKILKKEFCTDTGVVDKFKREATAIANLSDPNIVNILDVGTQDDINYIVMEYVKGKTLKQLIREKGKIDSQKTIEYAIQITKALDCAHRNNIIHRDVKPQNILVTEDDIIKVTDFGIAKSTDSQTITNTSKILGSAHYFSPEQAKGNYVDYRTDIYSLGIVLYEMVTGRVPFDGESPVTVALKHIQEPAIPPQIINPAIPDNLSKLILKAIEKEPINRYQSTKEFLNDLLKLQKNEDLNIITNNLEDDFTRVMRPVTDEIIAKENSARMNRVAKKKEIEENYDEEDEDEEDDDRPSGKKRKFIVLALVGVLILALGAVTAAMLFNPSPNKKVVDTKEIEVPKIKGLSKEEAQKVLEDKGFTMQIVEERISDEPEGTVIKSYPEEGTKVKDKEVRVYISSGAGKIKLRDLSDMDVKLAESSLKSDGLVLVVDGEEFSDSVVKGAIIKQNPGADSPVKKGDKIRVTVSKGKEDKFVTVPNVQGLSEEDATAKLKEKKFKVIPKYENTTNKDSDRKVIRQNPAPNYGAKENYEVTIVIGKYEEPKPELITVPDIKGMKATEAVSKLQGLGFKVSLNAQPEENDTIESYSPSGQQPKGTTITIVVKKAEDKPKGQ